MQPQSLDDGKDGVDVLHEDDLPKDFANQSKIDAVHAGHVKHMTLEERQTAWELARKIDPGVPWFSVRGIKFLFYCMVVCVGTADGSFDGTLFSSIVSMTQFLEYFDLPAIASSGTGIVMGMMNIGGVAAFLPAAWLPDKVGRRWPMFLGNVVTIFGAFLAGFAKNTPMLMGGRFLLGFAGIGASNKPYLAEITHAGNRGKWVGISNVFWYVGNILATGVCVPFGKMTSDWAWRIPVLLQAGPPVINCIFVLMIPESPRWLYAHGHRDKALKVLAALHSRDNDVNSPIVQLEIQEIESQISQEGADSRLWDFRAVFNTRANLYRWWLCTIMAIWGQLSGQGTVGYFLPALLQQAGITSGDRQRVLNLANSLVAFGCSFTGAMMVDRIGRRPLFMWAECVAICGLALIGGLVSPGGVQTSTRANAGISFMFLFNGLFAFGMTPLQALYPTEVLSFENRAKGLALQGLEMTACGCITMFGVPPMLGALGYKTPAYFVFMGFDIFGLYCVWKWAVETKQLSLEDLDEVFASDDPKKTSLQLARDAKVMARQEMEATQGA